MGLVPVMAMPHPLDINNVMSTELFKLPVYCHSSAVVENGPFYG